jgi:allophanate hydrolase
MTGVQLIVDQAGPGMSIQDRGRPGYLSGGLSCGGAADWLGLVEGAALLGQSGTEAAVEMAGIGGTFRVTQPTRIALTGAPMPATLDGRALAWNASHLIGPGQSLRIGAARQGVYGYLSVGGGIATPVFLGSRAAHMTAGLGAMLASGAVLPVGQDPHLDRTGLKIDPVLRFSGGFVRLLPTAQTDLFSQAERARFTNTAFVRDTRGNRQGVRLNFEGDGFRGVGQLSILSEIIMPGDIQMTGDGTPYVLLPECQTTGGYPRIGTVVPADLPVVAQAAPGTTLRFGFIDVEQALRDYRAPDEALREAARRITSLVRDPRDIPDLLGYQLIGGVINGRESDAP